MPRNLIPYADRLTLQRLLRRAQRGHCGICGSGLSQSPRETLDHVIPLSMGGFDGLGNLVLAHRECNVRKANRPPTGCEMVALIAVNCRLGTLPDRW